jgi:phosphate transport system protein
MERHFVQELEALKLDLTAMGGLVEQAIRDSIKAVLERRSDIARQVLTREDDVNTFEMRIDDAIVDLLALQQPVAGDLRFILAAMKINNDLERIGDHAVNIAESAISNASRLPLEVHLAIPEMATVAASMLREALRGFIHNDPQMCRGILANDDTIDELNRNTIEALAGVIRTQPAFVEQALELVRVSRNIERVADLATNIAEEVIFVAEAQVVKHHQEKRMQAGDTAEAKS